MHQLHCTELHGDRGIALLMTVVMLLLISAIGIASLQHAQDEATGSGRSRHHARTLHAADGLLQVVIQQLAQDNPENRQSPVSFTNFIQDPAGFWMSAQTGLPGSSVAAPIHHGGNWIRSGDSLNGSVLTNIYNVDVTASDSGGQVALQAQFAVLEKAGGGHYR